MLRHRVGERGGRGAGAVPPRAVGRRGEDPPRDASDASSFERDAAVRGGEGLRRAEAGGGRSAGAVVRRRARGEGGGGGVGEPSAEDEEDEIEDDDGRRAAIERGATARRWCYTTPIDDSYPDETRRRASRHPRAARSARSGRATPRGCFFSAKSPRSLARAKTLPRPRAWPDARARPDAPGRSRARLSASVNAPSPRIDPTRPGARTGARARSPRNIPRPRRERPAPARRRRRERSRPHPARARARRRTLPPRPRPRPPVPRDVARVSPSARR